ncbi:glycosyltransferase family 39 protein [Streptomyces sp. RB6PN25]|uniref:Glycosyltransferase family 39 protein n=1 Tax=Streptomyces humicola TaxID=2953240 RepID=A0ABT1PVG3_9ACTN|nr:glycosyltransferase family 39 protein [Streptomyces humicola]MCQ4081662.1 glycosyltransferase family 39 protein [Streptomyces humicola]
MVRTTVERAKASLRRAAPALWIYAAVRGCGLLALWAYAWYQGSHPRNLIGLGWDARWYNRIAEYGYGTIIPAADQHQIIYNDLSFFPLYPETVRLISAVVPIGAVNVALLVAWVATLLSAWAIYLIGARLYGHRVGIALVLLYALLPSAVIQTMAYTEPVMTAFAAWSLYAVLTRRWLWAGSLAALAGLSRPNGCAVAAAVCVGMLVDAWRRRNAGRGQNWRAWVGALISPLGWFGYVLWVGYETGTPTGYFKIQAGWGSKFDFGLSAARFFKHLVSHPDYFAYYVAAFIVAAFVILFALCITDRIPLTLLAYCAVLLLIGIGGAGFFNSKPRFLMPAFPLLIPAAIALARARPRTAWVAVISLAGFSFFYGTYLLTISRIAI